MARVKNFSPAEVFYLEGNRDKKSISEMAKELGVKEVSVKSWLNNNQKVKEDSTEASPEDVKPQKAFGKKNETVMSPEISMDIDEVARNVVRDVKERFKNDPDMIIQDS